MKLNKFVMAAALSLSVVSFSNAGTVYVTGSSAMRATFYSACTNDGAVFSPAPTFTGFGGKGSGDNWMAFSGTLVGGAGTTVIKCHWSGSEGGILDVASNNVVQQTHIADSALNGLDNAAANPTGGQLTAPVNSDLAMADNSQAYSYTKKPTLVGAKVGIITFQWVRNPGLWTGTNITDSQIRLAIGGASPLAVFTGNAADTGSYVYCQGRSADSGTRANTLGISKWGIYTPVNQIEIDGSGNMLDVDSSGNYQGNFGFSSGGTLAGVMGVNTTSKADLTVNGGTGFSMIGYMGVGDVSTAVTAGATPLAYNGVPFSPAAVKEGTYTFWGNEYIFKSPNAGTEAQTVYSKLAANSGINSFCDGVKAIKLTDMHCTSAGPGADPSHN